MEGALQVSVVQIETAETKVNLTIHIRDCSRQPHKGITVTVQKYMFEVIMYQRCICKLCNTLTSPTDMGLVGSHIPRLELTH